MTRVLLLEVVEGPVSLRVRTSFEPVWFACFKKRGCFEMRLGIEMEVVYFIVLYAFALEICRIVICKPKKYHLKRKSTDLIKTFQFSFKNGHQQKPKAKTPKISFVRSCPFIPFYLNLVPTRFLGSTTQPDQQKKTRNQQFHD